MKPDHFRPIHKCCMSCKSGVGFHLPNPVTGSPEKSQVECSKYNFDVIDPLFMICDDYTED